MRTRFLTRYPGNRPFIRTAFADLRVIELQRLAHPDTNTDRSTCLAGSPIPPHCPPITRPPDDCSVKEPSLDKGESLGERQSPPEFPGTLQVCAWSRTYTHTLTMVTS